MNTTNNQEEENFRDAKIVRVTSVFDKVGIKPITTYKYQRRNVKTYTLMGNDVQ